MNALLNVKYRGAIEEYNNAFQTHLQMLPVMNDPSFDPMAMGIYIKGISGVENTTYLVTTLNNAVQEKKAKTIFELMNIASQTEENLRMSRASRGSRNDQAPVRVPYVKANNYNNRSSYNYNRSGNAAGGTPYPRPFQTPQVNRFPAKANHVQFVSEVEQQYQSELHHLASTTEPDEGYGSEVDQLHVHEEQAEETASGEAPSELILNAIQQFSKFGSSNNVSPEEFEKRRQDRACFKCGRQGHFANKCPSTQFAGRKNGQ